VTGPTASRRPWYLRQRPKNLAGTSAFRLAENTNPTRTPSGTRPSPCCDVALHPQRPRLPENNTPPPPAPRSSFAAISGARKPDLGEGILCPTHRSRQPTGSTDIRKGPNQGRDGGFGRGVPDHLTAEGGPVLIARAVSSAAGESSMACRTVPSARIPFSTDMRLRDACCG
jgi:hypothetical protein